MKIEIDSNWDYLILAIVLMPFVSKIIGVSIVGFIVGFIVGVDYLIHDLSWLINKFF